MQLQEAHLPLLHQLAAFCAARGVAAWLVGGYTRDLALGRAAGDIDLAVAGDGLALARDFADVLGGAFVPLDDERGTGRVVLGVRPGNGNGLPGQRLSLDFAQLRAPTIEDDLRARDFTINALALPLSALVGSGPIGSPQEALIDPCGGLADLANRVLRPCHSEGLRDDPLRLLRGLRLAASLDLTIGPELDLLLRRDAPLITLPAAERVRDELLKLLATAGSATWLRYMDAVGLLTRIFPELEPARACDQPNVHFLPVLAHSLETVAAVDWMLAQLAGGELPLGADTPVALQTHPELLLELRFAPKLHSHFEEQVGGQQRAALFRLAALLHDNAKPQTKQLKPDGGVSFYDHQVLGAEVAQRIGQRLRLSRAAVAYLAGVVRAHMRPGQLGVQAVTLRAVLRLFRDTGGQGAGTGAYGIDVLLHAMADHLATRGPHVSPQGWRDHLAWTSSLLEIYWSQPAAPRLPLLDGKALMLALSIEPGKLVGELLREIQEAQAVGEISTEEQALKLAREMYARLS